MYRIGIIDDNITEVDDIQATIYSVWKKNADTPNEVDFKHYALSADPNFKEKLLEELRHDIEQKTIQSLIVDYKLDSMRQVIEGKKIIEYLRGEVPLFPTVILTNAPQGSKRENEIDPDKVYDKRTFFNLNVEDAEEMALNIYLNIKRYVTRRAELETEYATAMDELTSRDNADTDIELLSKISRIESELGGYTFTDQTTVEKGLDLSELREIIGELRMIENM